MSGATTLGQSRPERHGNEEVLLIPQNFSITGSSTSEYLVSYSAHSVGTIYQPLCSGRI